MKRLNLPIKIVLFLSVFLLLASCEDSKEEYVAPEKRIYLIIEGQKVLIINQENEQEEWTVEEDYYLISASKLKAFREAYNRQLEK